MITLVVDPEAAEEVNRFFLDKRTGNLTFNVKDGRILGLRIEKVLTVRT